MALIVGIILVFDFLINFIADLLNKNNIPALKPSFLEEMYTSERYKLVIDYQNDKWKVGVISSIFSLIFTLVVIYAGWANVLNDYLIPKVGEGVWLTLAYFGIIMLLSDIISIPIQWYSTFVVEQKFGFNKMTKILFIVDKLKGYFLTAIIGGGLLWVFNWCIETLGANFWILFWVIAMVFILCVNVFYTSLILPMFNKLELLDEGILKEMICKYADSVDFPIENVYIMDGSKRSSKANAFFSGFGKNKKVVLFDTLIKNHTNEEIVAVLAHEVGHFKHKHIIKGLVLSCLQIGGLLWVMSKILFMPELSAVLGASKYYLHLNLIVASFLFTPFSIFIGFAFNIFSRKNEFEADNYAKNTYSSAPLIAALKKLTNDGLGNPTPHTFYVWLHYSHPPLMQRLQNLEK